MAIRCVYTDLDGTLLGRGGSLLKDADGAFTLLGVRGLEACDRAGAEVVPVSGRRRATTGEIARLLGQTAYAFELGCGLVVDGEETLLTGHLQPRDGRSVYELIADSGAPRPPPAARRALVVRVDRGLRRPAPLARALRRAARVPLAVARGARLHA